MENGNSEALNLYEFLFDKKAKQFFAYADYSLRSGIHIQRDYPQPEELFRFIHRNFFSLKKYYKDFFKINLSEGGEEWNRYFFIDFEEETRGNIPADYRNYLKTEYIIIGLLFLKMYKLDANLELDSVDEFIKLLYSEYEEEKVGLRRLIADALVEKSSDLNDLRLEEIIKRAFNEFGQLGWIKWENDSKNNFKYLPAFERLRSLYQPQILRINELIKDLSNE